MNVPVFWVSRRDEILARGYADQGLLEAVLDRGVWRPPGAVTFEHHEVRGPFPEAAGAVVVINARTHSAPEHVEWLKCQLARLEWAVVLLCGDEEWDFPWRALSKHPSLRVYAMQPRPEHEGVCGLLPGGWYPQTREHLAAQDGIDRPLDWFFAGQITHDRRQECAAVLRDLPGGALFETDGYLKEAITRHDYFDLMAHAKIAPAPSGPYSTDCARAFEALEAGCVPVLDLRSAYGPDFDYWSLLLGDHGAPTISDWNALPTVVADVLPNWTARSNRVFARWQQWKRRLAHDLDNDIRKVAGTDRELATADDKITVIVTTSPVPRHPATDHIEQTIDSIREQLPTAEIVIVADGVRREQRRKTHDYDEYLRRLLWLTNTRWGNVVPLLLDQWGHQANAVRAALELVTTPLVLFVEHDTPLVGDIDWSGICAAVESGEANVVRFHEDVDLNPDHHGVIDPEVHTVDGVPLFRTFAWWQRPHVAPTRLYRDRIMPMFPLTSRTMIEDRVYGPIEQECRRGDGAGWWDWRMFVYAPEGSLRRSGHLDSRETDPKFDMRFR